MSVLIKGMEMPKSNTMFTVTLKVRQDGTAEFISTSGKTVKSFPMIEIPTPHGRLIDADKAAHSILMMSSHPCGCSIENVKDVVEWLRFVNGDGNNFAFPTIIEAEVE